MAGLWKNQTTLRASALSFVVYELFRFGERNKVFKKLLFNESGLKTGFLPLKHKVTKFH